MVPLQHQQQQPSLLLSELASPAMGQSPQLAAALL
jgi:hypothetical protein